ncbi:MAG: hypothetical protein CSB24_03795 [Deltaproteobacteria bacterium]|nr:MAG: hypothetical protein CSB24_03795 [Deltaproteobacteria bacterium]
MFITLQPLILASGSPRRKEFLKEAGLDFTIKTANVNEAVRDGESAPAYVERMAGDKGMAVCLQESARWVLAADTIVVRDEQIMGKPRHEQEACEMLLALSGRSHLVMTAFFVGNLSKNIKTLKTVTTEVVFSSFSPQTALAYVKTGEPADKAGAYGIQGKGTILVERINGSYANVVGLPMTELIEVLLKYKIIDFR